MDNLFFQHKMVHSDRVLYTPAPYARQTMIHLQEIGTLKALSPHTSKRSGLHSYLFFCVKSGTGKLYYDGAAYSLAGGDCVFLDCRKSYSHSTGDDLWSLQWAHFYGPALETIYDIFTENHPSPVFHPSFIREYGQLLEEIQQIANSERNTKDILICEKLMALLSHIMLDCESTDADRPLPLKAHTVAEVKKYLDGHFTQKMDLDTLAHLFFIDKYYLTRRFKQQYGITINTHLQNLRITYAKQLLRFSYKSIEAIAAECGIEDPNYFARLFKKIEGISPGEFRRGWMNGK